MAPLTRRTFLAESMAAAGLLSSGVAWPAAAPLQVGNVTGLYPVQVASLLAPQDTAEVVQALRRWPGRVAIGGGRYSMGGQVAVQGGLHLDMRGMNRPLWLRPAERTVRVQAGMRWRDLQDVLDPLDLSVRTMQSYANFSIGGAVSVNAHGRYVGHGPVGHSVRALQLVLADGSVVEASSTQNADLFAAAIGGYGAVGVITEVELVVDDNQRIERAVASVPLARYAAFFAESVLGDPRSLLHNADLLPPRFDAPLAVTWRTSTRAPTDPARLVPRHASYTLERGVLWMLTEVPGAGFLRKTVIQPLLLDKPAVTWRNHEASLDVAQLEPASRDGSTYVLQEYFVPVAAFLAFALALGPRLQCPWVDVVNVSIRHSPRDRIALLKWASDDVFSFVIYYKQRTHEAARQAVGEWTRGLIELALQHGGRYYLPYQLHATPAQFERAYPEVAQLRQLKHRVDPSGRLTNELWRRYL